MYLRYELNIYIFKLLFTKKKFFYKIKRFILNLFQHSLKRFFFEYSVLIFLSHTEPKECSHSSWKGTKVENDSLKRGFFSWDDLSWLGLLKHTFWVFNWFSVRWTFNMGEILTRSLHQGHPRTPMNFRTFFWMHRIAISWVWKRLIKVND